METSKLYLSHIGFLLQKAANCVNLVSRLTQVLSLSQKKIPLEAIFGMVALLSH
jgi:hypothetical protein